METLKYNRELTALIVIDPYNDFISEGGKIWPRIQNVAEANDCVPHMLQVLSAARNAGIRIFYALHRRYRPGDYETWRYMAPIQKAAWAHKAFEYGTWGGEIRAGFRAQGRGDCRPGALVLQWLCQHRFGLTAEETWHPSADRHRPYRAYLRRSDGSLCRGAWL